MTYNVIIAGGSFAGLAVAKELKGKRVLLIDRREIGEEQTSACAAPVKLLEAVGAEGSILEVHESLVIHTPSGEAVWRIKIPFCTFDYKRYCLDILNKLGSDVFITGVKRIEGNRVFTNRGEFEGKFVVDATGWRAALANSAIVNYKNYRNKTPLIFGIESEVDCQLPTGLHFYFDPVSFPKGYAWAFPCNGRVRFGVLSYYGETKLMKRLEDFMGRFDLKPKGIHGGYLACGLRETTTENVFVVGDAAGQCLPMTGEGIRTAIWAGLYCGRILRDILDKRISLDEGREIYSKFVWAQKRYYKGLYLFQRLLISTPRFLLGYLAKAISNGFILDAFMRRYMGVFESDSSTPKPGGSVAISNNIPPGSRK